MSNPLSAFPHIVKEIKLRWGTPPWFEKYINSLFLQDREEGRQGFPPDAFAELHRVLSVHQLFFGKAEDWKPEPCFMP